MLSSLLKKLDSSVVPFAKFAPVTTPVNTPVLPLIDLPPNVNTLAYSPVLTLIVDESVFFQVSVVAFVGFLA